jgi:hypothetical protein
MKTTRMNFLLGVLLVGLSLSGFWTPGVADSRARELLKSSSFLQTWLCKKELGGELFLETRLFFGLAKPDGSIISAEEFQAFVDNEVTSRFPKGFAQFPGKGQFRGSNGEVIKEDSRLLIFFYRFSRQRVSRVDEIRQAYVDQFQQESVLRVDDQSCLSF